MEREVGACVTARAAREERCFYELVWQSKRNEATSHLALRSIMLPIREYRDMLHLRPQTATATGQCCSTGSEGSESCQATPAIYETIPNIYKGITNVHKDGSMMYYMMDVGLEAESIVSGQHTATEPPGFDRRDTAPSILTTVR